MSRDGKVKSARCSIYLLAAVQQAQSINARKRGKGGASDGGLRAVIHSQRANAAQVHKGSVCDGWLVALVHKEILMPRRCGKMASVSSLQ